MNIRFSDFIEPVTADLPDQPEPEPDHCRCPKPDDQYLLEIDAGSVFIKHAACGKQPRNSDMSESLQLDATPVQIRPESNCTGWHESSCDCDFWAQITIPGLTSQADTTPKEN